MFIHAGPAGADGHGENQHLQQDKLYVMLWQLD